MIKITEIDLLRTANLMLIQHQEEAALECVVRASSCRMRGDHAGHRLWLEIVRRLPILERQYSEFVH
jgi:hypothetical protein